MPKWLIIVLVLVLVVILGCCGGFAACHWMCQRAGTAIGDFAREQAKKQGVEVDTGGGVSMPENFPDVPVYSGFKATAKFAPPGQNAGEVTFTGKATPAQVGKFYETEMAKRGWKQVSASAEGSTVSQTYTKDTQTVSIVADGNADSCTLMVNYGKQ